MAIKLGGLAARLKAGIDAAEQQRRQAEEEARIAAEAAARAKQEAHEARDEMMGELHAFGKQVEHFTVRKKKGTLVVGFDGRSLTFQPVGEGDRIDVHAEDEVHHLTRDEAKEWEVVLKEANGPRRLPLEFGLEELVTRYLAVPVVEPEAPEAPAPQSSAPEPAPEPAPPPRPAVKAAPDEVSPSKRIPSPRSKAPPGSALRELSNPWD